jgi:hypothetical protein
MCYRQISGYPQDRELLRNFNVLQANSLFLKEQGIFSRRTGNFFDGTGNFSAGTGNLREFHWALPVSWKREAGKSPAATATSPE